MCLNIVYFIAALFMYSLNLNTVIVVGPFPNATFAHEMQKL